MAQRDRGRVWFRSWVKSRASLFEENCSGFTGWRQEAHPPRPLRAAASGTARLGAAGILTGHAVLWCPTFDDKRKPD